MEYLSPKTIFALGATALSGLKSTRHFSQALSKYDSIAEACCTSVKIGDITVVISVFPNDRNRKYEHKIRSAFTELRQNLI